MKDWLRKSPKRLLKKSDKKKVKKGVDFPAEF